MPFPEDAEVIVKQVDSKNWEVRKALDYRGNLDPYTIPIGTGTDFASVPRIFAWFLPQYGSYTMAAILHDYLWRKHAAQGTMDWVDADGIFRRAMRELDVPFLRRWIMWASVRWAALFKPRGRKGWPREGWQVILFSVVALPFVAPPALLIIVALTAFNFVELILWVPLRLGAVARSSIQRRRPKEVNLPSVEWSTSQ
jgi:hypothetical protein